MNQGMRKLKKPRTPDPKFKCGFDPNHVNFRGYVAHIQTCADSECERRWNNHQAFRREVIGKSHCAILSPNEPQTLGAPDPSQVRPASFPERSTASRKRTTPKGPRSRTSFNAFGAIRNPKSPI